MPNGNGNGLSKVETLDLLRNIDLIGLTLTLEQLSGEPTPPMIKENLVMLLGEVRFQLEKSYNLNISSMETTGLGGKQPTKHHTTPAEAADAIMRDLTRDDGSAYGDDDPWGTYDPNDPDNR